VERADLHNQPPRTNANRIPFRVTGLPRVPTKNQPVGALGRPPRPVSPKPDQTRPVRPGSLQHALEVAEYGFAVFPLIKKVPFARSPVRMVTTMPSRTPRRLGLFGDGTGEATGSAWRPGRQVAFGA
jgi:hypothetical protein